MQFNEWLQLRESMSVYVQDYNFQNDLHDLDDLSNYLARNVLHPLLEKYPGKLATRPYYEIIIPDGTYYESGQQIINFYAAGFPEPMVQKILQGIKYHLDEKGVKYGPFKKEQSGMFKSEVYRIPILQFKGTQDAPPQLNMANANARLIFNDLLKYPDSDEGFFNIGVRELLMKIEQLERDQVELHQRDTYATQYPGKAKMYNMGLSASDIEQRLAILKQICKWAIAHHYDKLYVA